MALEVGIVGLPGAGKTTLFNVLTRAGAHVHERKEHVGMAPIADEPLEPVTTKPLIAVENRAGGIDLQLESELAELPEEEAAAFRDGGRSVLDEVVVRLKDALDLIAFFTASDKETRAWTLRRGETA